MIPNPRPCGVTGCDRLEKARRMCGKHYQRWYKYGDPEFVRYPRGITTEERLAFFSRVDPTTGCHVWTGSLDGGGYGMVHVDRHPYKAHRVAYELKYGPVPPGLMLDHFACSNRACCNPDHVRPVTAWENALRSDSITARNLAKTHCNNGHEFTPENTETRPEGGRACRICRRARWREWRARNPRRAATNA